MHCNSVFGFRDTKNNLKNTFWCLFFCNYCGKSWKCCNIATNDYKCHFDNLWNGRKTLTTTSGNGTPCYTSSDNNSSIIRNKNNWIN